MQNNEDVSLEVSSKGLKQNPVYDHVKYLVSCLILKVSFLAIFDLKEDNK